MLKKLFSFTIICSLCFMVSACGPSEEKIMQAQQKYRELIEIHNQVVEAHSLVEDASLDGELVALQGLVDEVAGHNLNEMEDEGIDVVIQSMDSLIESYREYQVKLADIKAAEEAAVLVDIPITLLNEAGFAFSFVSLYEKGDDASRTNVLVEEELFGNGESMEGLMIQRDVDNTEWVMELIDDKEIAYEIEISTKELKQTGEVITLRYNAEMEKIEIE